MVPAFDFIGHPEFNYRYYRWKHVVGSLPNDRWRCLNIPIKINKEHRKADIMNPLVNKTLTRVLRLEVEIKSNSK